MCHKGPPINPILSPVLLKTHPLSDRMNFPEVGVVGAIFFKLVDAVTNASRFFFCPADKPH